MWWRVKQILAELARPDAQKASWFAWAAAQLAHAMIGVVLAGALLFFLPALWAFAVAALGYAALKEVPDYLRARGWAGARDSVQDSLFVASGAALAVAIRGGHERLFLVVVCAAVVGLGIGIYGRIRK